MKSLASRNVDFETKRRRLEALNSKDQLKGEDIEEYKQLTLWYNEFKSKLENVDDEYESFVKTEEKQRQIEQLAITEAKSTLGSILDTVREENELKAEELQLLSNILSAKNEDPNALTEEAKELIQDNQFYKQSRLKYLFKKGLLEQKALKIGFLKVRIKNTLNKAKHEDTLVDGMYFKIQNLNDDIVLVYITRNSDCDRSRI
jgi:hypothetical protein